jgi:hypothetical protein
MHVYYGAEKLKMIDERMFVLLRLQSPLGMGALLGLAQEDARRPFQRLIDPAGTPPRQRPSLSEGPCKQTRHDDAHVPVRQVASGPQSASSLSSDPSPPRHARSPNSIRCAQDKLCFGHHLRWRSTKMLTSNAAFVRCPLVLSD